MPPILPGPAPRRDDSNIGALQAWSPDSRSLAFTFGNDYGEQIYLVSVRGGHPRQLTHEPGRSWESDLTFTAGGRRLRYFSELDTLYGNALWTMTPDGSDLRRPTRLAVRSKHRLGRQWRTAMAQGSNLHETAGRLRASARPSAGRASLANRRD